MVSCCNAGLTNQLIDRRLRHLKISLLRSGVWNNISYLIHTEIGKALLTEYTHFYKANCLYSLRIEYSYILAVNISLSLL